MKVEKKQIDALNLELTLTVEAADYAPVQKKKLADRRKTADFKGFRKGNVPASLIQKVYGEQILFESVNYVVYEQLEKYISDEKLHILGEPLASEKQPEVVWNDGNDFTFIFDLALTPEVDVEVAKDDVVNKYNIGITVKDKEQMAKNLKDYYAKKEETKTDEEIDKEVTDRMTEQYAQEADWRLTRDIRDYFVNKSGVVLPEAFLKRWLIAANEGKVTAEQVEKEFDGFLADFKWQLVRGALMRKWEFKIEDADLRAAAEAYVRYQYAMYGLPEVPEDMITEAVTNILKDQKQIDRLVEQVEDNKVLTRIKEEITIKPKKISAEKFREL